MQRFDGQTVLVTGGGRGLGRGVALVFASLGAQVALVSRSPDQVAEAVAAVEARGGRALGAALDVTDADALARFLNQVEQRLGPLDVLVNNAALIEPIAPIWRVDVAAWLRNLEIGLGGAFLALRLVAPDMVARRRGCVVNVTSGAGRPEARVRGWSAYSTAKAGLDQLTRLADAELRPHGVRVLGFNPGLVDTEMQTRIRATSAEDFEQVGLFHGFRRDGLLKDPEHTARAVAWLAGPDAAELAGEILDFDDPRVQAGLAVSAR